MAQDIPASATALLPVPLACLLSAFIDSEESFQQCYAKQLATVRRIIKAGASGSSGVGLRKESARYRVFPE